VATCRDGQARWASSHLLLGTRSDTFYMLTMYRKSKQDDLKPGQLRILRRLVAEKFK